MAALIPKNQKDENWQPLIKNRDYAVLCNPTDSIYLKLGQGGGMFLSFEPSSEDRSLNEVAYESGALNMLGKVKTGERYVIGRTSESTIKISHAIVSRQHLTFTLKGNVLILQDLGSTNGTYLYGETKHFDIAEYLEQHPPEKEQEGTLDWVHQEFGPSIVEFLAEYSQQHKGQN
ncbi:MAG: hypothetical protein KCHDKBKB_00837 [Elusimicrobia bacterium]|nr:hypothetical protein [Elusimicrobiota bacterium]